MVIQMVALAAAMVVQNPALASTADLAPERIGNYQMSYPFPSPDGKAVVFQGNFDGRWQLYSVDPELGEIKRLHVSTNDDTHPAWSPSGSHIAFISNRDGNDEVYVLDVGDGTVHSASPHPGKDGHPKWSADGKWLVFNRTFDPADKGGDGNSAIIRVRPDGSGLGTISDTPHVETFPSFSPDGKSVVLVEWFANAAGERNRNGELVIVDIASGRRRNITNSESFDAYPFWGPSGDWIYFSAVVAGGPNGREAAVHRIRPDGRDLQRLTPLDGVSDARAIPARDEKNLYFNMNTEGRTMIYRLPVQQK